MLTIVGKKLEEVTKDKKRLDGYFVILDKWSKNKVRGNYMGTAKDCRAMQGTLFHRLT